MKPRLSLITLGVTDLDRSTAFYNEGLGWEIAWQADDVRFFRLATVVLGLYPRDLLAKDANVPAEGSGFGGITLAHNVEDEGMVDTVLEEAKAAGGRIVKPAEKAFWGGYSGYFADPDGHLWEVAHNPAWTFDAAGNVIIPD